MKKIELQKISFMEMYFYAIMVMFAFDLGIVKYIAVWIYIFLDVGISIKKGNGIYNFGKSAKKYLEILGAIMILLIITVILQVKNGFNSYGVNEAIYFLTPILFIICYTKKMDNSKIENSLNISFYIFCIAFICKFLPNFTIENLKSISFNESYSPFESEDAYIFLIYECYYILKKDKRKWIAFIICFLSFKRISALFSIIALVFSRYLTSKKEIKNWLIVFMTTIFLTTVIVTCQLANNAQFEQWIEDNFNISLNKLTNDRAIRLNAVINSNEIKYGLGSITPYVTKFLNEGRGSNFKQRNLHDDMVKIYLECGIVGFISFVYLYLKAFSKNRMMFFIIFYVFVECNVNHLLGAGTPQLWIIIYLLLAYKNDCENKKSIDEKGEIVNENNGFYSNI